MRNVTLNDTPTVSAVIVALNEGAWVRRTVEAAVETSDGYRLEVIVVDDGSSDGSCALLGESPWAGNVRLVQGEGLGSHRARNTGAAAAAGEILVFLDGHVLPDPGWLEELTAQLCDPGVGLASLAVRSVEDPKSVGYTYTFVDENLSPGWAGPSDTKPYDSPCVSGCCIGVRRERFFELGGFDPGGVRWGLVDRELSIRTWYLGYRCVVSPRVQVAHYFKHGKPRNFSVSWEEYDVNLLRCVFTYFAGRRAQVILDNVRRRTSFARSLARVTEDKAFWDRRDDLQRRFRRGEEWYFAKFARETRRFQQRIEELMREREKQMEKTKRKVVCLACGTINVGIQIDCLRCQARLPEAHGVAQAQPMPVVGLVSGGLGSLSQVVQKPPEAKPAEPKPLGVDPPRVNPPEVKPAPAKLPEVELAQAKLPQVKPVEMKSPEVQPTNPITAGPKFCIKCGTLAQPGKKFCISCGHRIGA